MLIIREEQLKVFSKYVRSEFEKRMRKHLRTRFPDTTQHLNDPALNRLVITGIDRAESYGIVFEDDVQRYLEYMMVLSPDFDTDPKTSWAGVILSHSGIDGSEKMRRIDGVYIFSRRAGL